MSVDYIIVGSGLAGLMLCEQLRARDKSFVVVSNTSQQASIVASGLYNPVVLKRFNMAWNANLHVPVALSAYAQIESLLGIKIDDQRPIYRIFNSIEEQNNWFLACDKPKLQQFLVPKAIENDNSNVLAPYGFGEVKFTGRVDTKLLLDSYRNHLKSKDLYREETFDYSVLELNHEVNYKKITAKKLIFAEGFGLKKNPFFNTLPLEGTKGELLVVHAPDLKLNVILKSSVFVIPIGYDNYLVGSTYAWNDYSNTPTESAKNELLEKLQKVISCSYEVVQQRAGIRPTVVDRRPLVGQHEIHKNLYVMNGLGSRGVLIAPSIAKDLIAHIEDDIALTKEIDINRFKS
ncbi:MAG: FAD-dependent oxidoreductase [Flavobacteriaceae bacterium]|nr:FAD-dependent oxidoreductase [Flavobacteriaceae bacterium]